MIFRRQNVVFLLVASLFLASPCFLFSEETPWWEDLVTDGIYFDEKDAKEYIEGGRLPRSENYMQQAVLPTEFNEVGEDYRLKVGDTLEVFVYGEEKSKRDVVVDPRGMISYLFVNNIMAAGKTLRELRDTLTEGLRTYYRHVALCMTPVKFNAEYYTVDGVVKKPGKKPIVGRPTILSALCQSEGFTFVDYKDQLYDMCDLEKSFISRKGQYIPVDFTRLVREGDMSQDIPLEAGDYIYIPSRAIKQVFVVGEVAAPLSIDYFNTMSLAEAMAEAGDVMPRASSRIVVIRGSLACPKRFLIDYPRIVKGCAPDFPLQPGDIVYVPPERLYLWKEIFRAAVATFVDTVSAVAGTEAFIHVQPAAAGSFDNHSFFSGVSVP